MHHVEPGEFLEPGADRENARLDHRLFGPHGRRRRIGIVDRKLVGARLETGRRVEVFDHLDVIDVNVDRMLVVVMVDEPPLLDRIEPGLDQRHVGKCAAVERIHERFWILDARHVVEKSAGDQDLPFDVRRRVGEVGKCRVGTERLSFDERGGHATTLRGHGSRQHLCWKDEESIGVADDRGQDTQIPQHGRGIVGSVAGIEHAGRRQSLRTASTLRHFEHELALGRYRHCDREAARGWNQQPCTLVGGRIGDGGVGVSILADDRDRRMSPGRGFRELHIHVRNVTHVREHPDLGLSGLALNHRLELAVDRELHVSLVVGERRIRRHIPVRFAARRGEALQIAGDELEEPASVVDGKRPRIPHRGALCSRLRCAEVDRRERWTVGAVRQFVALRRRY